MSTPRHAVRMLIFCAVAVGLLGGCRSAFLEDAGRPQVAHQPKVDAYDLSHTVEGAGFDAAARDRLDAFLARQPRSAPLAVVVPPNRPAAVRTAETVTAWLRHRGLRPRGPLISPEVTADVQVVVRRYSVTLPACPDFTKFPGDTFENAPHSNWGCATATNLGLMVADPGDLIDGREIGPANGEVQAEAFQRYLEGETKPLTPEDVGTIESQQRTGGSGGGGS